MAEISFWDLFWRSRSAKDTVTKMEQGIRSINSLILCSSAWLKNITKKTKGRPVGGECCSWSSHFCPFVPDFGHMKRSVEEKKSRISHTQEEQNLRQQLTGSRTYVYCHLLPHVWNTTFLPRGRKMLLRVSWKRRERLISLVLAQLSVVVHFPSSVPPSSAHWWSLWLIQLFTRVWCCSTDILWKLFLSHDRKHHILHVCLSVVVSDWRLRLLLLKEPSSHDPHPTTSQGTALSPAYKKAKSPSEGWDSPRVVQGCGAALNPDHTNRSTAWQFKPTCCLGREGATKGGIKSSTLCFWHSRLSTKMAVKAL